MSRRGLLLLPMSQTPHDGIKGLALGDGQAFGFVEDRGCRSGMDTECTADPHTGGINARRAGLRGVGHGVNLRFLALIGG